MPLRAPVLTVLAAFLILAGIFAWSTPYMTSGQLRYQRGPDGMPAQVPDIGAPDERQHAFYVRHLMEGKGFPRLVPGAPDLGDTYQSHQPPLYYLAAAGWAKLTGTDPLDQKSGFMMRLPNLVIGGLLILGLAALARAAWPGRPEFEAAVAGFGLMPMVLALHGAVSNDPLLFCLATWSLAWAWKGMSEGWNWSRALAAGGFAGLALLTKTSALFLAPALLAAILLSKAKPRPAQIAAAAALPLALAAPWWLRNQQLYGDPLGLKVFSAAFVGSPQARVFIEGLGAPTYWWNMVGWWTGRSFIGAFGYMDIFLFEGSGKAGEAFYQAAILTAVGTMAIGALGWSKLRQEAGSWRTPALAGWVIAVAAALFVQFNLNYFQGQARYLYPAVGAFALLWGAGITRLFGAARTWSWIAGGGVLAMISILALSQLPQAFDLRRGLGLP
jgi:4-amino-4-deoxy-L-arabinose transferase-like glycosyltransferase